VEDDPKDPMKLFLGHAMLFVGSIWKNKSGWFLFVMSLWLLVAIEHVLTSAGIHHWFLTQVWLKPNPAWHHRPNETLTLFVHMQCWLLDPYGRIKGVDSCLLCPCGCWWPQKMCWHQLGSITDFWLKFGWKPTLHDTTDPMKLFLVHAMLFVGSIWKNKSGWFPFVMSLWLLVATEHVW
jgi:hypothetical protein